MTETLSAGEARLQSLLERHRDAGLLCLVEARALSAHAAGCGDLAVLLTEDPGRCAEAWDLAVVFPEVLRLHAGRLDAAAAMPRDSAEIARRYGVARFPALLMLRGGEYVGALEGMYDWARLAPAVAELLAAPVSRVPGVGIPLRAADQTCH